MSEREERRANGHVPSSSGFGSGSGTTNSPLQRARSLHLVIEGNKTNSQETGTKPVKQKRGPTKSDSSNLLSIIYAILTILIGLLFPLTEALHNTWLNTSYYTAFIVYQYGVASIFLLYLQLYLLRLPNPHSGHKKKHKVFDAAQIKTSASGIHITDAAREDSDTNRHSEAQQPHNRSRYRKALGHFTSIRGTGGGSSGSPESPSTRNHSGANISASIRYTNSVSNLNRHVQYSDEQFQRSPTVLDYSEGVGQHQQQHRYNSSLDSSADLDQLGEYMDEEAEVWIDTGRLGNLFSHEGSSFYLRMGCVLFAIGNLIYVSLELETSLEDIDGCPEAPYWWTYIIRLVFILLQTFVIFKNPSVHIHRQEPLVRFGFMHLISTNMGVWVRTLVHEIALEYHHLSHMHDDHHDDVYQNHTTSDPLHTDAPHYIHIQPFAAAAGDETPNCRGILQGAAQYLFPFVLEYSLIAMGTFIIMYFSINEHSDTAIQGLTNLIKIQALVDEPARGGASTELGSNPTNDSASVASAGSEDENILRKSHRGLFAGILLLSGSVISIVIFFFEMSKNPLTAQIVYLSNDIAIHTLLLVAGCAALFKLNVLNYVEKPASVDDVLLLLSMAGSLTFELTMIIAAADYIDNGLDKERTTSILALTSGLVASAQSIVQVLLILSGMRRYPSKQKHVDRMPGRGYITFLLVGNVALWIYRTLQAKELELHDVEMKYYGSLSWLLLVNISLPLLLFFRFHSSICLADVWHSAYTPLHHKISKGHSPSTTTASHTARGEYQGRQSTRDEGGYVGNPLTMGGALLRSISMGNLGSMEGGPRSPRPRSNHPGFSGSRGLDNIGFTLDDIESVNEMSDIHM